LFLSLSAHATGIDVIFSTIYVVFISLCSFAQRKKILAPVAVARNKFHFFVRAVLDCRSSIYTVSRKKHPGHFLL